MPKNRGKINYWFICAFGLSSISTVFHPSLIGLLVLNSIIFGFTAAIYNHKLNFLFDFINRLFDRRLTQVIYLVASIVCILDASSSPANAAFFDKAEKFMKIAFKNSDSTANIDVVIALVFNVLRALVLIYFAVALIDVVQKIRRDEDWQAVARTPLTILMVLTVADVLSGMIVGDTGQGGGQGGVQQI